MHGCTMLQNLFVPPTGSPLFSLSLSVLFISLLVTLSFRLPVMSDSILPIVFDSFSKSYCVISRLGFGSFGCAVLAKYRKSIKDLLLPEQGKKGTLLEPLKHNTSVKPHSDGLVAIKVMKTQLRRPTDYLRVNEIRFILAMPSHPNLLQIFNLFVDNFTGKLNIVMEPMNQNLYQFIQKHEGRAVAANTLKSMLAQLLNAIRHIHHHGYFHRDVKPENILVTATTQYYGGRQNVPPERAKDPYILKLCDYGLARHINNTKELTPYVSTRWYRAPEILLRQRRYSRPIDIWAFGSVAVELVNLRPIFSGMNETEQIWQILTRLGHPMYDDRLDDDFGGNWKEGPQLAENLGFYMPFMVSTSIYRVLSHPQHRELANTIKECFLWDPKQRPTAEELSRTPYFADTILEEDCTIAESQVSPIYPEVERELRATRPLDRFQCELALGVSACGRAKVSDVRKGTKIYSDPPIALPEPSPISLDNYGYGLAGEFMRKYTTLEQDLDSEQRQTYRDNAKISVPRDPGMLAVALEEQNLIPTPLLGATRFHVSTEHLDADN